MEIITDRQWHPLLADPSGERSEKPRKSGKTMVIDKGLGLHAYQDMLEASGNHIDMIKIGFGTSPLYPLPLLAQKIDMARTIGLSIMPGGTFLEIAVIQDAVDEFFRMIAELGFTAVEVSDGTIEMDRRLRTELIQRALDHRLTVFTEYGKKLSGTTIEIDDLVRTVEADLQAGAELVTIEGRESGMNVGIYDEQGRCQDQFIREIIERIPNQQHLMWETPLKSQQVHLLNLLGTDINLGNIAPDDILSVEALRRRLRSDTISVKKEPYSYVT